MMRELPRRLSSPRSIQRVEAFTQGHAAGLMALEKAHASICRGEVEWCVAGGVESWLEAETLEWLDAREQLKSSIHRWGFIPGEGAAFCLLASGRALRRAKLTAQVDVLSATSVKDVHGAGLDSVCVGEALTQALRTILQVLPPEVRVDQVACDLNGQRHRTDEYGFTVARLGARFRDATDVWTPADCWGDVGAASGPLLVNLVAASGQRRWAKGPRAVVWARSEGAERSAALLQLPASERQG
ncbi:beta-ketoacyl synthase N-terminal-like domain-containing protein [Myxococcus llanfairpwllgwyngyllgogerychwyrndrobwllllantysiliogogogochensis]|nr:beta-ketoacyl synthase N-terminal-like domain-containing protein [Myxococcus llanfairpwllgwyngyllgogerychwyrndrobwllllantysiliogogogochensis]